MKLWAIRLHNGWVWLLIGALLFLMPMLSFATAAPPGPGEIVLGLADDGRQAELGEGQVLVIELEANPSTGYGWQVEEFDETLLRQMDARFEPASNLLGAPGQQVFVFGAVQTGRTALKLVYRRSWEKDAPPVKTFAVQVQSVGVFKQASLPTATPEVKLKDLAPFDSTMLSLPATYNWCDLGGCTPVKDQGSCGSCWAFGTVGPLEANIKMWDSQTRNLAEQYLVSCASEYNGCSGGWFAHDYHEWKIPAGEAAAGSVYEADFPYQAMDSSEGVGCNFTPQPHTHHEKIATWIEVDPDVSIPAVPDIKQAIYEHGPVGVAICVSSAFGGYITGTFQTDESAACGGDVNHAVVLVGWDDSRQAWRLRNSWGTGWGDGGYMWIKWGTSNVGLGANYVVYGVPSNLTAASAGSNRINLMWVDNSLAESGFKIERSVNGTSNWTPLATVGTNTAAYTDTAVTCSTTYYYRVRAYTASADSSYSNVASAMACMTTPSAPSNLDAAPASATQINLAWTDNSNNETGFKIERSPDGTSGWAAIYTTTVNATSYANTGLTCDTAFYYRVRAFNVGGDSGYSNTALTTTASCASCADAYETDNDYSTANSFTVNGGAQAHNLHIAGDRDWVEFSATAGLVYTITTSNLGDDNDTYLELYDTNGSSRLAYDDDSGGSYSSKIVWTAPASGMYYVRVRHYSNQGSCTGYEYDLDVTGSSRGCADAYEPDSASASNLITVNGAAQTRNFDVAGDQDWAKFSVTAGQTYTIMTSNLGDGNDTVLELYSTDGTTLLMLNDNCLPGSGLASCINSWIAPSSSVYYVKAREISDRGGCVGYDYDLGVSSVGSFQVYLPLAARNTSNARTPNDSYYSYQWGLPQVNAPAAWGQSTGAGVTIAVVDTGVDLNHPDLAGKIVAGWDFANGDSTPQDDHGHGTHVAGIAAATTNNSLGVAGLGWDAKVMPVKVLYSDGSGYDSDVASGITWAVNNGTKVINLSLGGEGWSQTLQDATD